MSVLGDPADKGTDQFNPVHNRRSGYGDKLQMILKVARDGGTLYAGEGLQIIEYYEGLLNAQS